MRLNCISALVLTVSAVTACGTGGGPPSVVIDADTQRRAYSEVFLSSLSDRGEPAMGFASEQSRLAVSDSEGRRYEVVLDRDSQVLGLDIPEDRDFGDEEGTTYPEIYPSLAALGSPAFVSASLLAVKAKQFDDGLYAAVELMAEYGSGAFPSRHALWRDVLSGVAADEGEGSVDAAALLGAATAFVGQTGDFPTEVAREADTLRERFLEDRWRSLPLGFYGLSEELAGIFRRDRLLQSELEVPAATALANAIAGGQSTTNAYEAVLHLAESVTNSFVTPDLRPTVRALSEGLAAEVPESTALLPASRSYEAELIKSLYGDSPIPEGFELAAEMTARIRDGRLQLEPSHQSGWYDYQTWALEPLADPDRAGEAAHLRLSETYRRELESLFKAILGLTRETHVKQLEIPVAGAAYPGAQIALTIRPGLTLEPTITYYRRRARSYAFIRDVLERAFGTEALTINARLTPSGPMNMALIDELRFLERLFTGAAEHASGEIGLERDRDVSEEQAAEGLAVYETWRATLGDDPDLGVDVRMMVPVFYDVAREKMKVWAVLGYASKPLAVTFHNPPTVVQVRDVAGRVVSLENLTVEFVGESHDLVYLVSAEVYADEPKTRAEFRAHCDKYRTFAAILENLR